ncbi:MAG: pyridoxal-dependent decarboxylase [Clostridiaceae bacterium]
MGCEMKTPYFMINEEDLKNNVDSLKSALNSYWDNYIIGYSFKTNSLPWLVDYFKEKNFYAEVVSDDEYQLASVVGYEKHKFIYNSMCKSRETFFEAIKNCCIVNIDSERELQWLKEMDTEDCGKYEVGIRVNFELEKQCPGETEMGDKGSRFGFCYENGELKKAIDYIGGLKNFSLKGLHLHCGTKSRSINVYRAISRTACEIKKAYSLDLKYVDVGGGYFGGLPDKPNFSDYLKAISHELSSEFDKERLTLIVEPGTSLVSLPFSFVTSVIDVKKTKANNFVVTDGSRINIDPLMHKTSFFYKVKYNSGNKGDILKTQVISGFTCMEDDRFFVLENQPALSLGDNVIFEKTGAYTMCLSPLFIRYYPDVYVKKGGNIFKVREKLKAEEYCRMHSLRGDNIFD